MAGHWGFTRGHTQGGDFGRDLLVRENLQLLAKGDSRPTRAGLDFVAISFYFRYCRWKSVRNELRN